MMHVRYKFDKSEHHGIGLFADEDIDKGHVVYTASPLLDLNLTQAQFDSLTEAEKAEVKWWGFFDKPSQKWHVDFDVSKFMNHSYEATTVQDTAHDEAHLVATRDIKAGEELTQNYLDFESPEELKERGIALQNLN